MKRITSKILLISLFVFSLSSCDLILINDSTISTNTSLPNTTIPSSTKPNNTTTNVTKPSITKPSTTKPSTTITESIFTSTTIIEKNEPSEFLKALFGDDVVIYDTDDKNPYGIDLSTYGDDVKAIFYEPNIASYKDPYTSVDTQAFYNNFKIAQTYEDAYYRTVHGLISGDCSSQSHLPNSNPIVENNVCVKATDALYILSASGEYIGYMPNSFNSERILYYGAGYTSMNDVCAYLLAFGEVPANSKYGTSSTYKNKAIEKWGIYGRVNVANFSGDTNKYPYEPLLPTITYTDFTETDFGSKGDFICGGATQRVYNNGDSISRGTCRFVFTSDPDVTKINERYVFYTYNHYNDFQEYLNYDNGFGIRFGNESAGNPYCSSGSSYKDTYNKPTQYPNVISHNFPQN